MRLKSNYDEVVIEALEQHDVIEIANAMGVHKIRVVQMAQRIYRPNTHQCRGFKELTGRSLLECQPT